MSVRNGICENIARMCMHKVREAMKSNKNNEMKWTLYMDTQIIKQQP